MALQGEGGAEQSFTLLTLEGSLLGVGLQEEWGMFTMCKRSCLGGDSDEDDGRRPCVFGWLTRCGKSSSKGLKVQSASVFLTVPLPSPPWPTCPPE